MAREAQALPAARRDVDANCQTWTGVDIASNSVAALAAAVPRWTNRGTQGTNSTSFLGSVNSDHICKRNGR